MRRASLHAQQLGAGLLRVEGDVLERDADARAHAVGLVDDVVAGDGGAPRRGAEQRAQHAHGGGLAGPVGAEEAVDLAARDRQVEAVDGVGLVEAARQRLGVDGGSARRRIG